MCLNLFDLGQSVLEFKQRRLYHSQPLTLHKFQFQGVLWSICDDSLQEEIIEEVGVEEAGCLPHNNHIDQGRKSWFHAVQPNLLHVTELFGRNPALEPGFDNVVPNSDEGGTGVGVPDYIHVLIHVFDDFFVGDVADDTDIDVFGSVVGCVVIQDHLLTDGLDVVEGAEDGQAQLVVGVDAEVCHFESGLQRHRDAGFFQFPTSAVIYLSIVLRSFSTSCARKTELVTMSPTIAMPALMCSRAMLIEKQVFSRVVKAVMTPPRDSTSSQSWSLRRFIVPLNCRCSTKWAVPLDYTVQFRLPQFIQKQICAMSESMCSVHTQIPFFERVIEKGREQLKQEGYYPTSKFFILGDTLQNALLIRLNIDKIYKWYLSLVETYRQYKVCIQTLLVKYYRDNITCSETQCSPVLEGYHDSGDFHLFEGFRAHFAVGLLHGEYEVQHECTGEEERDESRQSQANEHVVEAGDQCGTPCTHSDAQAETDVFDIRRVYFHRVRDEEVADEGDREPDQLHCMSFTIIDTLYTYFVTHVSPFTMHSALMVLKLDTKLLTAITNTNPKKAFTRFTFKRMGYDISTANISLILNKIKLFDVSSPSSGRRMKDPKQMQSLYTHNNSRGMLILRKRGLLSISLYVDFFIDKLANQSASVSPSKPQGSAPLLFSLAIQLSTFLASSYSLLECRCMGEGFQNVSTRYTPVRKGAMTTAQVQSQLGTWSTLQRACTRGEMPHTAKTTTIDHALNLSPPISLRQMRLETKKPLPKKPIAQQAQGRTKGRRGEVMAMMQAAAKYSEVVRRERQIGQSNCPAPDANRNIRVKCSRQREMRQVSKAYVRITKLKISSRRFWQVLLSPTNSRAFQMLNYGRLIFLELIFIYLHLQCSVWYRQDINLMAEELNEEEEMIINQEYKLWKKQSSGLYDFILLHSLQCPSSTFQWLPPTHPSLQTVTHDALICGNSPDPDGSHLLRIRLRMPIEGKCQEYIADKSLKITVVEKMLHPHQINRARYCPTRPQLLAVSNAKGQIHLTTMQKPIAELGGHLSEGYGLAWNNLSPNVLASGHTDKLICVWDVEKGKEDSGKLLPLHQIVHHSAPIEDVAWHKHHPNILASCSDDRLIMVWDLRFRHSSDRKPLFEVVAHTDEVYSVDFSPFNQFLFCSASADENLSVWDLRNLTRAFTNFHGKKNSIVKAQWNPHTATVIGSCGFGRNVDVWDLSKKNSQGSRLFRHLGHRSKVVDFDWNQQEKLLIGSVEEGNCLHVWEMSKQLYYQDQESK